MSTEIDRRAGACDGLDALDCSRHDNCTALHTPSTSGGNAFDSCAAAPAFVPR